MSEDYCACCDLPSYSCGKALQAQRQAEQRALRERALQRPGVVASQHTIRSCPGCGMQVPAGDPIRRTPDGWIGVLCCDGVSE